MAVAKNPGVGQGKGGGRPRGATREVEEVRLRLSPAVAEMLRVAAEAQGAPAWRVVENLLQANLGEPREVVPGPEVPAFALEVAGEVVAFLDAHREAPDEAVRVLRRAWRQAVRLASHDLKTSASVANQEQK